MLLSNSLILLILATGWIHGEEELVWLEDVTNDHDRRHLELGLPENLAFNLERNIGRSLKLSLSENRRLNANAPVYEPISENGKQKLVRKEAVPILTTRFYHDKSMGASVKVDCNNQMYGPCQRSLEGSLNIDGDTYEIKPAQFARSKAASSYVPHTLTKMSLDDIKADEEKRYNDAKPHQDKHVQKSRLAKLLRSLLLKTELDIADTAERMLSKADRQKRQTTTYAIEIVAAVDHVFWNKYFDKTSANNGMDRTQATEFVIRKKLAHIINGVSLRYESIDNSAVNMYVTISKILFYKSESSSPKAPSVPTQISDNKNYADVDPYINGLPSWVAGLENIEHDDHFMVFTGYELYDGEISNNDVLGVAFLGGACGSKRVSLQEDADYFILTSVAAHELGHNVGMDHDGNGTSSSCAPESQFLMAPSVTSFSPDEAYTINPWRFSPCSIEALKTFIGSGKCFTDPGDYWNKAAWDLHNTKKPGEVYSLDAQCKLIRGDTSGLCSTTSAAVCRTMTCKKEGDTCYDDFYAAARGSTCGENKWCIDGACVTKPSSVTSTTVTTKAPSTATTKAPSTATTKAPSTATTKAPSTATTKAPSTATTKAPSTATTKAPSTATTKAPSTATTKAPSTATTKAPSTATTKASSTTTTQASSTTTSEETDTTLTTWAGIMFR